MADEETKDDAAQEEPKIIIDDDWKSQAQAEKEKLAQEVETDQAAAPAESAAPAGEPGEPGEPAGPRELPPASLSTLVTMLATQALMALQGMEDPQTGQRMVDLDLAKHHIDTIAILEEKTKGNVTDEEKALLDQVVYQVRMQYVQIAQAAS
jgi:hypothetical protein